MLTAHIKYQKRCLERPTAAAEFKVAEDDIYDIIDKDMSIDDILSDPEVPSELCGDDDLDTLKVKSIDLEIRMLAFMEWMADAFAADENEAFPGHAAPVDPGRSRGMPG